VAGSYTFINRAKSNAGHLAMHRQRIVGLLAHARRPSPRDLRTVRRTGEAGIQVTQTILGTISRIDD